MLVILALALGQYKIAESVGLCGVASTYATTGTVSALNLNANFVQASTTNSTPQCVQGDSATLTQMQTTVNPYPANAESLATSLEGELQRLRFVLKKSTGSTQWYSYENLTVVPPGDSLSGSTVNAMRFGAVPDGQTDSTAFIQAAWNATPQDGTLYIPCGRYVITSRLFPPVGVAGQRWGGRVTGCGTGHNGGAAGAGPGTVLVGNFAGAIFDFSDITISSGNAGVIVDNMYLINAGTVGNTAGYGIKLKGCIGCTFRNLGINAWRGIWFTRGGSVISSTAIDVGIVCPTSTVGSGSVGIGFVSHISGAKISSCEHGIRLVGTQNTVVESIDIEVNEIGIAIGLDQDGVSDNVTTAFFAGLTFEGNSTDIFLRSCTNCTFASINTHGSTSAPNAAGQSVYGFRITGNCQHCLMTSSNISGNYSQATVSLEATSGDMTFQRTVAGANTKGKTWNVLGDLGMYTFMDTNFYPEESDIAAATTAKTYAFLKRDLRVRSLGGVSYITPLIDGQNAFMPGLVVTGAATSQVVTFQVTRTATQSKVVTATPSAGGSLVDGTTYYYCGAQASAHGENTPSTTGGCGSLEKSCAPTGANLSCTLAFTAGTPANGYKTRVYRGRTSGGPYEGYIEGTLNSSANIIDAGTGGVSDAAGTLGLTARKDTSRVDSMDMVETDANYGVTCTPNWSTIIYTSAKATTSFTETFGTAAPGGGGLMDCTLFRG